MLLYVNITERKSQFHVRLRITAPTGPKITSRRRGTVTWDINNVGRTRRRLVEEGLQAALSCKYNPNSARPRIFDGAAEAKLIALTCSPAPEGFARWSLRLLEEKVVELNIVEFGV